MSKFVFVFIIFSTLISCTNSKNKKVVFNSFINNDSIQTPLFVVDEEMHNFGNLEAGEIVSYNFEIANKGNSTLKIDSINTGCGCISVDWFKKEIKSGNKEKIEVTFNSAGEWGNVYKPIVFYSNCKKNESQIIITAIVKNQLFNNE